jgi:hypothetical protein
MSDAIRPAIDEMVTQIKTKQDEIADLKRAVNVLCKVVHTDPMFPDVDAEQKLAQAGPTRPDLYYNKPLSTAVREYLEWRGQACSAEDIMKALEQGGFDFDALGWRENNRLKNLSISLAKNTSMFKRLPTGVFGLKSAYPETATVKRKSRGKGNIQEPLDLELPTALETEQVESEVEDVNEDETKSTEVEAITV